MILHTSPLSVFSVLQHFALIGHSLFSGVASMLCYCYLKVTVCLKMTLKGLLRASLLLWVKIKLYQSHNSAICTRRSIIHFYLSYHIIKNIKGWDFAGEREKAQLNCTLLMYFKMFNRYCYMGKELSWSEITVIQREWGCLFFFLLDMLQECDQMEAWLTHAQKY